MSARRFVGVFGLAALLTIPMMASADVEIEAQVREYFSDAPIMAEIAACESKFTQFGKGDTALHGGMGGKMIGIFQIYSDIHAAYAKERGMDIYTTEGNLAYARHLYEREGTRPWLSSFPCWGSKATSSPENTPVAASVSSGSLTVNLSLGQEHPQIATLQKILNSNGFVLTTEGPGSLGNETTRYGALTRNAVRRFQCAQKIVCAGDEYSSGYGFVGPRTRAALLALGSSAIAAPVSHPDPVATTTTSQSHSHTSTNTQTSGTDGAEVARLQAQIDELTKKLKQMLTEG